MAAGEAGCLGKGTERVGQQVGLEDGEGLDGGLESQMAKGSGLCWFAQGVGLSHWGGERPHGCASQTGYRYSAWFLTQPGTLKTLKKDTNTNLHLN